MSLADFFKGKKKAKGAIASAPVATAAPASPIPPAQPKRKKLGANYLVWGGMLVCGGIIVAVVAKQGGSLEDTARVVRQQEDARKALTKAYDQAIPDPDAAARQALESARTEEQRRPVTSALPTAPLPGAAVAIPADADAVLEQRRKELDQAYAEINARKKSSGAGSGSAGVPQSAEAKPEAMGEDRRNPGFVGYSKADRKDGGPLAPVAQDQAQLTQATQAPTDAVPGRIGAAELRMAYEKGKVDGAGTGAGQSLVRNSNQNWRTDDVSGDSKVAKVNTAQRLEGRNTVIAGTVVPAVIEQGIDTALPGSLRARVTQDIYDSRTGMHLVIARGSMLVGQYRSEVGDGQHRVYAVFDRLVTPGGAVVALSKTEASDRIAISGVPGELHTHFWKRLGIATLLALESAFLEKKVGNVGVVSSGSSNQATSSGAAQILVKTAEAELKRQYSIPPNITVAPGSQMTLVLLENIEVPSNYVR